MNTTNRTPRDFGGALPVESPLENSEVLGRVQRSADWMQTRLRDRVRAMFGHVNMLYSLHDSRDPSRHAEALALRDSLLKSIEEITQSCKTL